MIATQLAQRLNEDVNRGEYMSPFSYVAADEFVEVMLGGYVVILYNTETGKVAPQRRAFELAVKQFPRQPSWTEFLEKDVRAFSDKVSKLT